MIEADNTFDVVRNLKSVSLLKIEKSLSGLEEGFTLVETIGTIRCEKIKTRFEESKKKERKKKKYLFVCCG